MVCESVSQNKHTLTNLPKLIDGAKRHSNSHYENDFSVSNAEGSRNTKIVFFESPPTADFQKTILIMRIA
jgi:hypothetical protein